mmetsp:Transcript_15922/g.21056  ORF Transcript_15922/g.21056 Transcript_15922/m.21056 type:complete len:693 (-) Transcript_15922:301-2379(-)
MSHTNDQSAYYRHETPITEKGDAYVGLFGSQKLMETVPTTCGLKLAVIDCMIVGQIVECQNGTTNNSLVLQGIFALGQDESEEGRRHLEHFVTNDNLKWPNGVIPFVLEPGFEEVAEQQIVAAMWYWMQSTPARFIPKTTEEDYVVIFPYDNKCSSYIGRVGGMQTMSVDSTGLCKTGNMMHELGHALGYMHEHSRPDRDSFVEILMENVENEDSHNFEIISYGTSYGTNTYDYGSMMHYGSTHFSIDGSETVVADSEKFAEYQEENPNAYMGQRSYMSQRDKDLASSMYGDCFPEDDDSERRNATWYAGEWGGCQLACKGSYQHRLVYCGYSDTGRCAPQEQCKGLSPPSSQSCDLVGDEANPISFGLSTDSLFNLSQVTGVLQNAYNYDDYEFFPWAGHHHSYNPALNPPVTDGSGDSNGRFMYYSPGLQVPVGSAKNEVWLETPVVNSEAENPCEISFKYYIHDSGGGIELHRVFCECEVQRLWTKYGDTDEWNDATVTLAYDQPYSKIRFVAVGGSYAFGGIGLDDVHFSSGCYWKSDNLPFEGGSFLADSKNCFIDPLVNGDSIQWWVICLGIGCGLLLLGCSVALGRCWYLKKYAKKSKMESYGYWLRCLGIRPKKIPKSPAPQSEARKSLQKKGFPKISITGAYLDNCEDKEENSTVTRSRCSTLSMDKIKMTKKSGNNVVIPNV